MRKTKFPYKFNECILEASDDHDKDLVVIYPVRMQDVTVHEFILIDGYLNASNIIVESICKEKIGPLQDKLALPLLNLYVNAIEFSLKCLINKLISHSKCKTCKLISIPNGYEKILQSHDLIKLVNIASKMLPKMNFLHYFLGFSKIARFIKQFSLYGVDSSSSRYYLEKNKKIKKIHQKQSFADFEKINENVKYICNCIINFCEHDNFHLCATGEFSKRRINELQNAYEAMLSMRRCFL